MTEDERAFRKAFFDMSEMVKVLYEERILRMQGESSRHPRGEGSPGGEGHGNGKKPPPTPPSSSPPSSPSYSSSSTTTTLQYVHPHTSKGVGKLPFLKLDVKFELLMYNGEMNVGNLDNWIHQLDVYGRINNLQ